jgi:DNA-binding CsgD family transcriptional regulator
MGEAATWGAAALGELARAVVDAFGTVLGQDDLPVRDRGEIRLMQGRLLLQLGEFERASGVIESAVDELADSPELAARAMISLGFPRGSQWPVGRHLEWVNRATRMMPLAPSREHRTWLAVDRASALLFLGEEAGWAAADEIDVDAPTLVEQRHIARGLMNVGHLAIVWGRDVEARRRLTAAADLMTATGYQRLTNSVSITLAHLDWHAGKWHGLADRLRAMPYADDTLPEAGLEAALVLALIELASGARERAQNGLEAVLAGARQRGLTDVEYAPAAALGRLAMADGRAGEAIEITTSGIETIAGKQMWVWATDIAPVHVEALVATGNLTKADDVVRRFRSGLGHRDAPAARAALATATGVVTQARGDARRAAGIFAEAARAWTSLPRPYDELLALERQGTSLLAAGDRDDALSVLGSAQHGLRALGADWDADRIARALRHQGVDVARAWRGGRRGYGDSLSPREVDVVRLVARGMTNRAVAEALYISPRTVDRHLSSAMRKLDVASRTAVAMAAGELGLLGDGSRSPVSDARPSNFG